MWFFPTQLLKQLARLWKPRPTREAAYLHHIGWWDGTIKNPRILGNKVKLLHKTYIHFLLLLYQMTTNLVVWNNTILSLSSSAGRKSSWSQWTHLQSEGVSRVASSWRLTGESISWPLPASRSCLHSLDCGPFLHLQNQQQLVESLPSLLDSTSSSTFKDPCGSTGPTHITWDLNSICPPKLPLVLYPSIFTGSGHQDMDIFGGHSASREPEQLLSL